jgi:hypothetical protein
MTKHAWFRTARRLRAAGVAIFLVVVSGSAPALAEEGGESKLDQSAEKVGNNFGELLKGMGQELRKVISSDDTSGNSAADKAGTGETGSATDKSGSAVKSK